MSEYSYKTMLVATDEACLAKRAVAFHSDDYLTFEELEYVAPQRMTSQTCPRCRKDHPDDSYVLYEAERGETDGYGGFHYTKVRPSYLDNSDQLELGL